MSHSHSHSHSHGDNHDHGHSHGGGSHEAPSETYSSQLLNSKIDTSQVVCLNLQNSPDEISKLFKDSSLRYQLKPVIKSDADEQLILHIPFLNGSVKLHSVILRTNGTVYCPKTIKFFKNSRDIDFDNVNDTRPAFEVTHPEVGVAYEDDDELMPEELVTESDFVEHYLPKHTFSGVRCLTIFIEDIYGDEEESHLHSIELRGEFTELTRDPVITLYELAPNPADHKVLEEAKYRVDY